MYLLFLIVQHVATITDINVFLLLSLILISTWELIKQFLGIKK